ncbi:MAG: methyltransferase [Thermodesulfovibrionales bacterium]
MVTGARRDLLLLRQASSFLAPRIILTANNLRLFDLLDRKELTAAGLSRRLGTDARATGLLLNSLAGLGLLSKRSSVFRNAPVASRYLVAGKKEYQGDILRHYDSLWKSWSGLDAVVRTGKPNRAPRDHRSFILGMDNLARLKVRQVVDAIGLEGVRTVLDLGGGPGTYAVEFSRRKKQVTLFDFPETLAIAKEVITPAAMQRITLLPGDFTTDDFGRGYDLVLISQIFHAYSPAECTTMLRKCRRALNPGGRVVVQEFLVDESGTAPVWGALFAVNMLVNTPAGRTYTPKEMTGWMKKVGLVKVSSKILGETVLITGLKTPTRASTP